MGFFDGIETAESTTRLPDLCYGSALVKVTKIEGFRPQAGGKGYNVIGEGEVVEHTTRANQPGDPVKIFWCDLESKFPKASLGDLRKFLEAVNGGPITAALSEEAVQRNAFAGKIVRVYAVKGKENSKKPGSYFTNYTYAPADAPIDTPPAPAAPAPAAFPPAGWFAHPQAPGHFYNATGETRTEAQLRAA